MKVHLKWIIIALCSSAIMFPVGFDSQLVQAKSSEHAKSGKKVGKKLSKKYRGSSSGKWEKKSKKRSKKMAAKKSSYRHKKSAKRYAPKRVRHPDYVFYTCDQHSPNVLLNKARPYEAVIQDASRTYGVNPNLIKAVITAETCFDPYARSPKGAKGLMQLMPATGRRFGATHHYDVYQNINAGTAYLRWLLNRYQGSLPHAIAAYNSGEGTVDAYGLGVPYKETQNYKRQVLNAYNKLSTPATRYTQTVAYPSVEQRRAYYQRLYELRQQRQAQQPRVQYAHARQVYAQPLRASAPAYQRVANTPSCQTVSRRLYQSAQAVNAGNIRSFQYTVGEGENLYQVAHQTGVSAHTIRAYNRLPSVQLRAGLRLKVGQCHL